MKSLNNKLTLFLYWGKCALKEGVNTYISVSWITVFPYINLKTTKQITNIRQILNLNIYYNYYYGWVIIYNIYFGYNQFIARDVWIRGKLFFNVSFFLCLICGRIWYLDNYSWYLNKMHNWQLPLTIYRHTEGAFTLHTSI